MYQELKKYAGIKILSFFLENPWRRIYIKELARELNISSSSSKYFCDFFEKKEILSYEKIGNTKLSFLRDNVYTRELKKTHYLIMFKEKGIEKIFEECYAGAIYGSFSTGRFNEESDIDILRIVKNKKTSKDEVLKFQKKINREVQITDIPYTKWENMKKSKDPFAKEVLKNHILIKGENL